MKEAQYLNQLLRGEALGWKALENVATYVRGVTYSKSDETTDERGYKVLRANNITLSGNTLNFDDVKYVSQTARVKPEQKLREGDILISAASGSRAHVGKVAYVSTNLDYYFGGFMGVVRCSASLTPRYLFHLMTSDIFKAYLEETLNSSTINNLGSALIGRFKIPIPCPDKPERSVAIQTEIASILDAFTAVTSELTSELNARRKQYQYYRDRLLNFRDAEAEWKPLGEIGEFIRGKRFTKADYVDDGINVIHYGEIYTRYGTWTTEAFSKVRRELTSSLRFAAPGDVVIAGVGETVEDVGKAVAWLGEGEVAIHDDSYAFRHSMNPKFIAYAMQTATFAAEKAKHVSRGKVNRLLIDGMTKVRIPIPYPGNRQRSLAEQDRIVAILDKFNTLTNSISEGLPREIALRQQQYAYYRDRLLSFPRLKTA